MNIYASKIEESYKYTIIGRMGNSVTSYLLLHILQCWRGCEVDEKYWSLPMVLKCSHMMYKYYSGIGLPPIKQKEERKIIHNGIFNNIPNFIKNSLNVDYIKDGFVMYNNKLIFHKREVIPPIPDSMIPVDCCKKTPIIGFITDDMTSKF